MRIAVVVSLALATSGLAAAGDGPSGRRSGAARRVAAIETVEQRLATMVVKANEDRRTPRVEQYLALTATADFAASKRPRVAELVEMLADDEATPALRNLVREALTSITHRQNDPDVVLGTGGRTKRAAFSRDRLVPLLLRPGPKAAQARAIAADVLDSYWHFADEAIVAYDPQDEKTWKKAADTYRRLLQSK